MKHRRRLLHMCASITTRMKNTSIENAMKIYACLVVFSNKYKTTQHFSAAQICVKRSDSNLNKITISQCNESCIYSLCCNLSAKTNESVSLLVSCYAMKTTRFSSALLTNLINFEYRAVVRRVEIYFHVTGASLVDCNHSKISTLKSTWIEARS
jgi:hypothetical protein